MSHARTIDPKDMINIMIPRRGKVLVSFPLHATHPYERMGKHIRDEIYARCDYRVRYGSKTRFDTIHVFHEV